MTSRESRAAVRGSAHRRRQSKDRPPDLSDLKIVLLGKSVPENSRVGNFILGRAAFDSEVPPGIIERVRRRLKDRHLIIINSPQLLQTNISDHQITQTVRECVYLSDPGPHVIVLLLKHDQCSAEDQECVEKVLLSFSESVYQHTMVLTTQETTETSDILQKIIQKCANRHFSLQRSSSPDDLLQTFEDIVKVNDGQHLDCAEASQYLSVEKQTTERLAECKELNLVVCGSDGTLKSSVSELILQQTDEEPQDRQITLEELPALIGLSEEEVMRQTLHCVSLCDPGVHAFLLIIPEAPLNNEDKAEMEEIQRIFSSRINKHIMILIMQSSEHQTADLSEETQSVIQSFGGRHHFFGPKTQVSTLMENIEQMLEENRGNVFSTETFLEAQMKKLMKFEEMKKKIHSYETHLLSQASRENTDDDLRIVLLGKTGVGKSATGNTILGRDAFKAEASFESLTKESQRETCEINGRRITVIDTPGLFDTELTNEEIQREITNCISMILPGPHVFLLLIPLGRFTKHEETSVKIIQETFGEKSLMFTMMLFTRGDDLMNKTIDQCLGNPGSPLMKLIEACGNRYHVFNNNQTEDRTQVSDLLEKIDNMVKANGGSFYSCKMFRQMEREKQEQQMKILKNRVREREEEMKKLEEEKERMKMMMEEERQNQDKERKRGEKELEREIREQEKHQREIRDEMRRERETFRHEIEEMRLEKEKRKKERETLKTEYDTEIDRLMNRIENERQNHETERKKREEEFNEREERYKTQMKEKEELMKKQEEEKERNDEERKRREEKFRELEERYQTLMKEKEKTEEKMREEMKREREEWEKQKLEEKTRREKEDEKRREKEHRDWDEFNQRLKEERYIIESEKEVLQSKHEEEENKMKMMMERMNREREELMKHEEKERMNVKMDEERQNQDKERKRREEEFREKEERYKRLIKEREENESKLFEQIKQERMQWEKQKQDERQKREEEKNKKEETEKQKSKPYKKQQSEDSDLITGLNLVLLGRTGAGKSASGNTILGRQAFRSKKSFTSVTPDVAVASGTVGHIPVTVCDTPSFCGPELSEDEIQQKIEKVLQRCESGLCVFLLVIKADRFAEEERETVEEIEKLLGEERLNKTWILFTRGDELEEENLTIQEFISETEALKKLIQKYDQRYHVFNNKTKGPNAQVQMLLIKILKPYFDTMVGEDKLKLNPLKRNIPENAEAVTPAASLLSRRIVLLGKTGVGKSAAGNTILGQKEFKSVMSRDSVTCGCSEKHATVSGRSVTVVDTPGFFDTQLKPEELMTEIARSVYLSSPGPHAFLIVFPVNMRLTEHEQQIPQQIEIMFGELVLKYSILLFTHGDLLEERSVEDLIKQNCRLRHLVDQCGGRVHIFNNKDHNNREQVNDLLQKIDTMIEQNGGRHYSNQMFEDAHRFRREEEERRQREEEERQRQEEKQREQEIERVRKETEERISAELKPHRLAEQERERQKQDCVCS